jgi:two-component system LytT family sensor kinase
MITLKKKVWIETVLHLAFWAGVFYILTSLNSSHIHLARNRSIVSDQGEGSISSYVYLILVFLAALFYGNIFWVFRKVIRYKNVIVRLAICAAWFTMVFGANYLIVGPMFKHANVAEPPSGLSFQKGVIQKDLLMYSPKPDPPPDTGVVNFMISNWQHMQPIMLLAFLVILGISIAYFSLKEWAKSELIQTKLHAYQLSTEIKFLRSQVNPHFLFNTLNNLFSMAKGKGNEELADGISKLSGMMRYMLYDSNEESVSLIKEITYLEEFITLNKLRYNDGEVTVKFSYPAQPIGISIAPMLFIPFIENAFKHGVMIEKSSMIDIVLSVEKRQLLFTCENAIYRIKKMEDEKSGIGLENVKRRLKLLYPHQHELSIKEEGGKFAVALKINLEQ